MGYKPPKNAVLGVDEGPAKEGGRLLAGFLNGLGQFNSSARTTAIGHSYGSAVVGAAMANGLRADNVVHSGSPGIGASSIAETGYGGSVWFARAANDTWVDAQVRFCVGELFEACLYASDPHGPPPDGFAGGRRLFTGDASGHNQYYDADFASLSSIGAVVNGTARRYPSGMWGE